MTATHMERIVLARHCNGAPVPDDFRLETLPIPELAEGQLLIANRFGSLSRGLGGGSAS